MEERQRNDDGQALPLIVLVMAAAGMLALALGTLGNDIVDRAEATTAADAAALAGARNGAAAALEVARANGAELRDYERLPSGDVRATAERDGVAASARARARRDGPASTSSMTAGGSRTGLAPAMRAALARAEQLLGQPIPVTSGYRSPAEQRDLWARRASNPYPVAQPGRSKHELGLAIDVPSVFAERLAAVAPDAGLCRPYPVADPVHFEICGRGFTMRVGG